MTAALAARLTTTFLGVYFVQSSAELIVRRDAMSHRGLLAWPVQSLAARPLIARPFTGLANALLNYPQVLAVVSCRLVAGLFLIAGIVLPRSVYIASLFVASISSLLLSYRHAYGGDGADQMALILSLALTLGHAFDSREGISYVLVFVAFQVILAYETAGIAKITSPRWRNGSGFAGIIATHSYGSPWLRRAIRRSTLVPLVMSWGIMLWLTTFAIAFSLGGWFLLGALAVGMCFHIGNALVMRLHTFLWVFPSAYPALYYVREFWLLKIR